MSLNELMKDENFKNKYNNAKKQYNDLLKIINDETKVQKIEKTTENIYKMAKKNGIKSTARYFNIYPSTVRYHIKKYENSKE